jgi:hypothetical protein
VALLWTPFAKLDYKLRQTRQVISSFFILLLLFVVTFAILGMDMMKDKLKMDEHGHILSKHEIQGYKGELKSTRLNFDSFW